MKSNNYENFVNYFEKYRKFFYQKILSIIFKRYNNPLKNLLWLYQNEKQLNLELVKEDLILKLKSKNIIEDKKSGEYRLSHHMDLKTGFYKGRQVLDPKE